MQGNFYDAQAPKKPTNHHINLSKVLEQRLVKMLLEENLEAIEAYNRRIEASGLFSDDLRKF